MAKPSLTPGGKAARQEWFDTKVDLTSTCWHLVDVRESMALALIAPQLTDRQRARFEARALFLEARRDQLKTRLEQLRPFQKVRFSA